MSDPITIRRAGREDMAEVAALAGVIWRACYPGIISTAQIEYMLARMYDLQVLQRELQEGAAFFAACAGTRMVGFASCSPVADPRCFKLHKLYVHPRFQRRGVGAALLSFAEQFARASGATAIILNVNKNNGPAIRAYQRYGFAVAESVILDIGNGFAMDDFVMRHEF